MDQDANEIKLSPAVSLIVDSKRIQSKNMTDHERLKKLRNDLLMISKTLAFRKIELPKVSEFKIKGRDNRKIGMRAYYPVESHVQPALIFFHGGGFLSGSIDTHDTLCRKIAIECGLVVFLVEYSLAPEYKFPAYLEDAQDAIHYIFGQAKQLQIDKQRICIGGDSAGGNLAAVMTHYFKNNPNIRFAYQLLLCPAMEIYKMDSPTFQIYNERFTVSKEDIQWGNSILFNSVEEEMLPEASPVYFDDFAGLPPGITVTAEYDIMRHDAEVYAGKCKAASIPMEIMQYKGMIHDFFIYGKIIKESTEMLRYISEKINKIIT